MKRATSSIIFLLLFAISGNSQSIHTTYTHTWKYDTTFTGTAGTMDFSYTGYAQTFVASPGTYTLEVWGASGGDGSGDQSSAIYASSAGGKGGYSIGTLNVTTSTSLYVYVGGAGSTGLTYVGGPLSGGYNGGGASGYNGSSNYNCGGGSGGGGTDIRINSSSLYARVIVAGGGGGAGNQWNVVPTGGYGGGSTAGSGGNGGSSWGYGGTGGTSSYGGSAGQYSYDGFAGSFGQGGDGYTSNYNSAGGGGGGGWYGGGSGTQGSSAGSGGGGGGSGYVYTSSTAAYYPSGCMLTSANYLSSALTYAGNITFASTTGSYENGHSGNGYARISYNNQTIDKIDSSIIHTDIKTTITDEICPTGFYNDYGFCISASTLTPGMTHTFSKKFTRVNSDSTVILNLKIRAAIEIFEEHEGFLPYYWPVTGKTYTESGIYEFNSISVDGCDSTVILALTIHDKTGIGEESQNSITVFPNPANDYVTISVDNDGLYQLQIFNMYGQTIRKVELTGKTNRISLSGIGSGIYLFQITQNAKTVKTIKVVKE